MQTYDRVLDDTLIQLRDMYQAGVVLVGNDDVSREFVDNWKLLPVDLGSVETMGPKVYYAEWVDGRFAPDKVSFLTGRLQGIPHISLKIPDNLVSRHYVAKVLSQNTYDFVFNGPYVEVITNTLAESQRVADMVDEALYNLSLDGRVVVFTLSDIRLVDLYKQVSADLYNDNSGGSKSSVSYKVSNFYVFSQLIEPTKVVFTEEKRLKRLVYAKLAETSKF
jgi:hypothetical protein